MDFFSTIIYSACVIGVISSIIDMTSPEGNLKKHLDLVIGLILLITVITPFFSKNFKFNLSTDFKIPKKNIIYTQIKDSEKTILIEQAEKETANYFKNKFNDVKIEYNDIVIKCCLNEYNQIEITSVSVYTNHNDSRIKDLIKSELKKTDIKVIVGDTFERKDKPNI